MGCAKTEFGRLEDGRMVYRYTLTNEQGASASFTDLGGIWLTMVVPDRDGRMAVLNCTMNGLSDRRGVIYGPKGYIAIENINNFASVTVYDANYKAVRSVKAPKQITGYEYEVYSCMEAIEKGEKECWEMPHAETLRIMKQMDELRAQWGVVFPFEREDADPKENVEVLTGEVEDTILDDTDIQA